MEERIFDFSKAETYKKITKEDIFNSYDQTILFERYFGQPVSLKKSYLNRLRTDNGAGCRFRYRNGILYFCDFAKSKSYDVIEWVREDFGLSYPEALKKIYNDFKIGNFIQKPIMQTPYDIKESEIKISIQPKTYTKAFVDYFQKHLISYKTCQQENVYCVGKLYFNKEEFYLPENDLCIAYHYPEIDKIKILRPNQPKQFKWRTDVPNTYIDGLTSIDRSLGYVIIVKSKKDKMLLIELGYRNVLAVQMEGTFVITPETEAVLEGLRKIIWMDNDITGKKVSEHYASLGYEPILLEDYFYEVFHITDPTDYTREFQETSKIKHLLNQTIQK